MTVRAAFEAAFVVLVTAVPVMTAALVAAKSVRELRDARRDRLVRELRPRVLASLDDGQPELRLGSRRRIVAEAIALSLLPKLRGADRDALARILDGGDVLAGARRGLRARSASRRQRSAELLGAAGRPGSTRRLIALLSDPDLGVRMAAARALGRFGEADAVRALIQALDDRRLPANTATMAILRIGTPAARGLQEALDSPIAHTRSIAAELTGSLGLTQARQRIEMLVDDPEPNVRLAAVRALGRLGAQTSVGRLIEHLERELANPPAAREQDLAVAMVTALGNIGHPEAIPVLFEAAGRRHRLSTAASDALGRIVARRRVVVPGNAERVIAFGGGPAGGSEPVLIEGAA